MMSDGQKPDKGWRSLTRFGRSAVLLLLFGLALGWVGYAIGGDPGTTIRDYIAVPIVVIGAVLVTREIVRQAR